jgi:microcystin-dependent protein
MPVNALWLQNVDYPARIDRTVFDSIWTEGILGAGSFQVSPSSPVGMSVQVSAGVAVVTGDNQVFQGKYLCREQAPTLGLTITAAPGSGSRRDLVVLQVRDPNATGPAGDDAVLAVVTGVASASPVDPAVPASALVLARVRVASGTGSITAGMIDDLRVQAVDAYNTTPNNSITPSQLSPAVVEALVPTGSIVPFGGTVAPTGWLLCDGTAYTTAAYPALSAVLGSQYNVSGGQVSPPAGQFRVPILVGRVPVGRSTSEPEFNDMGETGGAKSVILTSGQSGLVAHSHTVTVSGTSDPNNVGHDHAQQGTFGTTGQNLDHFHSGTTAANGTHDHSIDVQGMAQQSHAHSSSLLDSVAGKPNPSTGSSVATTQPINNAGSHDHFINTNGTSNDHAHFVTISGSTGGQSANHNHPFSGSGSAATVAAANATQAHDNLQPYIVVTYIIKA